MFPIRRRPPGRMVVPYRAAGTSGVAEPEERRRPEMKNVTITELNSTGRRGLRPGHRHRHRHRLRRRRGRQRRRRRLGLQHRRQHRDHGRRRRRPRRLDRRQRQHPDERLHRRRLRRPRLGHSTPRARTCCSAPATSSTSTPRATPRPSPATATTSSATSTSRPRRTWTAPSTWPSATATTSRPSRTTAPPTRTPSTTTHSTDGSYNTLVEDSFNEHYEDNDTTDDLLARLLQRELRRQRHDDVGLVERGARVELVPGRRHVLAGRRGRGERGRRVGRRQRRGARRLTADRPSRTTRPPTTRPPDDHRPDVHRPLRLRRVWTGSREHPGYLPRVLPRPIVTGSLRLTSVSPRPARRRCTP